MTTYTVPAHLQLSARIAAAKAAARQVLDLAAAGADTAEARALAAAEARAARRPAPAAPAAAEMTAEDVAWLHALPDYEPPAPAPARRPTDGAWLRELLTR